MTSLEKKGITKLLKYLRSKEFEPTSDETARQMRQASKELRKNFKLRDVNL